MLTSVQRPPPPQKYYLVVNLVRITCVDELVKALENRIEPKEIAIEKSMFTPTSGCRRRLTWLGSTEGYRAKCIRRD